MASTVNEPDVSETQGNIPTTKRRRRYSQQTGVEGSFGIDSGGTLTKLVYFNPRDAPSLPLYVVKEQLHTVNGVRPEKSLDIDWTGDLSLRFIKIPNCNVMDFVKFVAETDLASRFGVKTICITGGGAYKYADLVHETLNIPVHQLDEFEMIIKGLNFLLEYDASNEVFTVDWKTEEQTFGVFREEPDHPKYFPYLLVNIGSGVSILRVNGPNSFERVSGSHIGGGTFWGLCRMLTHVQSYEEVMTLSKKGDSHKVDLLVGDIYGEDSEKYKKLGLASAIIASSFGKVATSGGKKVNSEDYKPEDIIRSLLFMIANNISQIAYLNAKLQGIEHVLFSGGFVQNNSYLWKRLAFSIEFWSGGNMKAHFLRHDGYLGAIGALIASHTYHQELRKQENL